ncbi:MAG: glycosyltransferase [Caldilineaceae bacterium]|nr:glycosyltransferase [Caldilineaceae bacterium]
MSGKPPSPALSAPKAAIAALRAALPRWSHLERPVLLIIGDPQRPEVQILGQSLSADATVITAGPRNLPDDPTWDLCLCLDLPEEAHRGEFIEKLAQRCERLLFAPPCLMADPIRQAAELRDWLGLLAEAGLIYDIDGEALLSPSEGFLLRRAQLPATEALGYLTLALHEQTARLDRQRNISLAQDDQLIALTRLSLALDKQIAQAMQQRARLDQAWDEVSGNWSQLEQSPGYILLKRVQLARARVAPPGSRREQLLEMGIGWARILNRRGLRGLVNHLHGEIGWRTHSFTARFDRRRHYHIETVEIPLVQPRPEINAHQSPVDIVICVHNALADLQRCLASVIEQTAQPYALILVDDGSDDPTRAYLAEFARSHPAATLLRNETAIGYTRAANQGMRHSRADFVLLLNSDTRVTPGWLDRLVACAESDPEIGIVGPLSNTASWQSIPDIALGADWAENPLPTGMDLNGWATQLAAGSARLYPSMPLLNGFCLLIRRALIDEIGFFDEQIFGAGYGEENDYALRARAASWKLALADDTYIYHAQSRSYSHERRKQLSVQAATALTAKHGTTVIETSVDICREAPILEGIRARAAALPDRARTLAQGRNRFAGRRVLFLLPVDSPGGGANVVIAESRAMQAMGVEVAVFNQREKQPDFEKSYPTLGIPVYYGEPTDLAALAAGYDAVIATWYTTVAWMQPLSARRSPPVLGYYIQDFEPYFFAPESVERQLALQSYTAIPHLRLFTKTTWNQQEVSSQVGVQPALVGPSVEIDRFRPRRLDPLSYVERPLRVTAMVRPSSPHRAPDLTMRLLRRLSHRYGDDVEITVFGVKPNDPALATLPQDFHWQLAGILEPDRVATLLAQADIFADFSTYQAMGLTALEAMASGAAVIVPQKGGAISFVRPDTNALMADTASEAACWAALVRLMEDDDLRRWLRQRAIYDACRFHPERAAYQLLNILFPAPGEQR